MPPRKITIDLSIYLDKTDQLLEASILSYYIGKPYTRFTNHGITSWHKMRDMLETVTGQELRRFGQIPPAVAKKDFPNGVF